MSSPNDPPIIITGGSVTIEFDPNTFTSDSSSSGRYSNQEKVIKRVEITGRDITSYDSAATGRDITIRVTYGNP
ncbi:MAG: hypothetical protein QOE46_2770 [Acidobacteriota bacterium]|jgi:hypothetical protein|nr:hypothetical protein [Acidobacteriota bacterium]